MEAHAVSKYNLISPRKARLTASLIKGKPVKEALAILKATPRKAAGMLAKTLNSAIANAMVKEGSGELDAESLFVVNAAIDGGPVMPRWRPRAYGRASRIRKRMSHIKVTVSTEMPAELKGTRTARKLQSMAAPGKKKRKKKKKK
jgi:large subunit ribosomal protein L22